MLYSSHRGVSRRGEEWAGGGLEADPAQIPALLKDPGKPGHPWAATSL